MPVAPSPLQATAVGARVSFVVFGLLLARAAAQADTEAAMNPVPAIDPTWMDRTGEDQVSNQTMAVLGTIYDYTDTNLLACEWFGWADAHDDDDVRRLFAYFNRAGKIHAAYCLRIHDAITLSSTDTLEVTAHAGTAHDGSCARASPRMKKPARARVRACALPLLGPCLTSD